jgi:hypothetical protein
MLCDSDHLKVRYQLYRSYLLFELDSKFPSRRRQKGCQVRIPLHIFQAVHIVISEEEDDLSQRFVQTQLLIKANVVFLLREPTFCEARH